MLLSSRICKQILNEFLEYETLNDVPNIKYVFFLFGLVYVPLDR